TPHQASHTLLGTDDTLLFEFLVDTRTAISLAAVFKDRLDLLGQLLISLLALALWTFAPGIVAAAGNLHHSTQSAYGELPLRLLYELVSHRGRTVKIPTAFFRISTSSLRRAFSRCN